MPIAVEQSAAALNTKKSKFTAAFGTFVFIDLLLLWFSFFPFGVETSIHLRLFGLFLFGSDECCITELL